MRRTGPPVYPRARGAKIKGMPTIYDKDGLSPRIRGHMPGPLGHWRWRDLSPRTRGEQKVLFPHPPFCRSIPAHAGGARERTGDDRLVWVYPPACGGNISRRVVEVYETGLSPRMRGEPVTPEAPLGECGSIPRMRGIPDRTHATLFTHGLSPRRQGGAIRADFVKAAEGLSPSM